VRIGEPVVFERRVERSIGRPSASPALHRQIRGPRPAWGKVTHLAKSRGKVGDPYPDDIQPHRRIFDREIEIV